MFVAVRRLSLFVALVAVGCGSTAKTVIKTVTAPAASSASTTSASGGPLTTLRVPSPSMAPTIDAGQLVTVSLAPNYFPRVGDIVVFHPPAGADPVSPVCGDSNQGAGHSQACDQPTARESSQTFIKRIVAGPGDTITISNGHVVRNGAREQDSSYTEPCGSDPSCNFPTPITIPRGYYFMLGDNRGASDDSRFWGPVPRTYITGKVIR